MTIDLDANVSLMLVKISPSFFNFYENVYVWLYQLFGGFLMSVSYMQMKICSWIG